ncbi:Pentatricopeptide repeat [Dillenia turbinata]|uniref:Pentatricopeptide repeat n=1 Tax=Dillenia turbinata TaxID=194707 RepID=A0AAN8V5H3_9MAGN
MGLSRRVLPSLISISKTNHLRLHLAPQLINPRTIHAIQGHQLVVNSLCDSFKRGFNWDTLNQKFDSIVFNNSIIEQVLLQFKEPPTAAARALNFFHWSAKKTNSKHGVRSYCIAIHILVRNRMFVDAKALLESLLSNNSEDSLKFMVVDTMLDTFKVCESTPFVFDLLVQTYSKLRMLEMGFDVCCYLEGHGYCLNVKTFNTLIHFVQKSDGYVLVWRIYEHMVNSRVYPNEETVKSMVSALCKEGKLKQYIEVLDRIHGKRCSPMVIVNTSLMFRMFEAGKVEKGLVLMKRLLQKNMILDTICYTLVVYAKVKVDSLESALAVYEEMLKRGFCANSFIYTLFISEYCRRRQVDEASLLMEEMKNLGLEPYDETFDHLITGYTRNGKLRESVMLCNEMMERGLIPSCSAFNEIVEKISKAGDVKEANALLTRLLDGGFIPDEVTYYHLMNGYGRDGDIQDVLKLYYELENSSISPGQLAFSSLIKNLCQCGKMEEAEKYLTIMKTRSLDPSLCTYDSLIVGHFEKGNKTRASSLYDEMVTKGLKPSLELRRLDSTWEASSV